MPDVINPITNLRDGFICIDCGRIYHFECVASKCPYKKRRVGLCLVKNEEGYFHACEYLRIRYYER